MKTITVLENGKKFEFSFEDMLKYHGVGYPGGVAPVSYTHLDVYKRQAWECGRRI